MRLLHPRSLFYEITRPPLYLFVYLAHILPDDAQGHQDRSSDEPHGNQKGSPSRNGIAFYIHHDAIGYRYQRNEDEQQAEHGNITQRADGKRRDAVQRKTEHLAERIFRLAGHTLLTVVIHPCEG